MIIILFWQSFWSSTSCLHSLQKVSKSLVKVSVMRCGVLSSHYSKKSTEHTCPLGNWFVYPWTQLCLSLSGYLLPTTGHKSIKIKNHENTGHELQLIFMLEIRKKKASQWLWPWYSYWADLSIPETADPLGFLHATVSRVYTE